MTSLARNAALRFDTRANRQGFTHRLLGWGGNHLQALSFSLGKFRQNPISNLMTSLVIAIAIALPATLSILLKNTRTISDSWDISGDVTLYLHSDVSDTDGVALARELNRHAGVQSTRFIGRDEALAVFRRLSGFGEVLDALEDNPLPAAIVLSPIVEASSVEQLRLLVDGLGQREEVSSAQVDLRWIERLNAIIDLIWRIVSIISGLLGLAVLSIVGNTIRLDIHNRREEIVVIKLIGATDAFVRRPFLYGGLVYGAAGGLLGTLLVIATLWFIDAPSTYLAALYGSTFQWATIGVSTVLLLISTGALLGLIGAWLSVGRHLREIEPR